MGRSYLMGQYPRKPARRRPLPRLPPNERLQPGTTVLVGRQHSTGRCPCCAAVWITDDEHGWTCLDTGKLICTHTT